MSTNAGTDHIFKKVNIDYGGDNKGGPTRCMYRYLSLHMSRHTYKTRAHFTRYSNFPISVRLTNNKIHT